jgi:hypothetical protein
MSGYPHRREEPCGKTAVFLHEPSTLRSPSQPVCLRFKILVQQNNVQKICADMSKANRSHRMWVQPDVLGLFLDNVRSFSIIVGLSAMIFSWNLGRKWRCSRAGRFYVIAPLHVAILSNDHGDASQCLS